MLCAEYKRLHDESIHISNDVISKRIYRWMKQRNLSHQRVTHQAQNTQHCSDIMLDWVKYLDDQIAMYNVPFDHVVNWDEKNVDFSTKSNYTLSECGSRTVSIRSAQSSQRATVMLGVSMCGEKLPPYVIFKGKDTARSRIRTEFTSNNMGYNPHHVYTVQDKAWMDEVKMLEFVDKVWKPFTQRKAEKSDCPFLVIMDVFSVHMMESVVRLLAECNTHVQYVPAGYTSKLQVMDVGVNAPFK